MHRFLPLLLFFLLLPGASGQNFAGEIDLLYPEFAHPQADALRAIEKRDYRFIHVDRHGKDVPGLERYPRLVEAHGTQFVRQRLLLFATASEKFSFRLRARAYAREYNETLLRYLLGPSPKK